MEDISNYIFNSVAKCYGELPICNTCFRPLYNDISKEGNIDGLLRLIEDETLGMWGEDYYDGKWHRANNSVAFMQDPGYGDFIYDDEEAKKIIELLDERDGIKQE